MICSPFADMMENYDSQQQQQQQGDLADIVRASTSSSTSGLTLSEDHWAMFPSDITLNDFQSSITHHHHHVVDDQNDDFGDPFMSTNNFTHHPLLINDHLSTSSSSTASFYTTTNNPHHGFLPAGGLGFRPPSNNNIFSRMLQISPNPNMSEPQAPPTAGGLLLKVSAPTSDVIICSKAEAANAAGGGMVQISSPRNAGIKRRKSQAKKVVCIPAPTPANSRPSGEVVPSDLWAWRKYGQKPIKGSPYPRGYYRCSSSKGCSARKQVERSRTDPNMLVITYTSEHNHPWPTQRNALAGSTRAQPNKAGSGSKSSNSGSQTHKPAATNNTNELEDHDDKDKPNISSDNIPMFDSSLVKEENMDDQQMEMEMEMDGCGDVFGSEGFDLHSTYKPSLHCEDLFADLGEIETDSLSLLFSQGFDQDRDGENKGNMLDHFFDWAGNINTKQP